jgi:hypothetical protein
VNTGHLSGSVSGDVRLTLPDSTGRTDTPPLGGVRPVSGVRSSGIGSGT